MEKKEYLEKIKSKYIFKNIFEYIKDPNFKYKLFIHSKSLQDKVGIELADYVANKLELDISSYFHIYQSENFDEDILKKRLQEDLLKYRLDSNLFEKILIKKLKSKYEEIKSNNKNENLYYLLYKNWKLKIDYYSPLLDIVSKTEYFSEIFMIILNIETIQKYNQKKSYSSMFEKLNKSKVKYPEIVFIYKNTDDIQYLRELNIDFYKVKSLTVQLCFGLSFFERSSLKKDYKYFFENLFSLEGIENNLISLYLKNVSDKNTIEPVYFKNINNLHSLEYLELNDYKLSQAFELKLYNLKEIKFESCKNISFDDSDIFKIEKITIYKSYIPNPKSLIKFPYLKELNLDSNNYFIDFTSLKKLIKIEANAFDFIKLEENELEEVNLNINSFDKEETEEKMLEKIIISKTIKKINIKFEKIKNENILKINGENTSLIEARINWNHSGDCIIDLLQNQKFLNLTKLTIIIDPPYYNYKTGHEYYKPNLEVLSKKDCKLNQFYIIMAKKANLKLYCCKLEDLIQAVFDIRFGIKVKINFPILNEKCDIIFKSLKTFKYYITDIDTQTLKNIYFNIDKMPNLKSFSLDGKINDEDLYIEFIKKMLSLDLDYLRIHTGLTESRPYFKEDELKEIYPQINCEKFRNHKISISKIR